MFAIIATMCYTDMKIGSKENLKIKNKTWSWRGVQKGRKIEGNGDRQAANCRAPFLEKEAGRWHF